MRYSGNMGINNMQGAFHEACVYFIHDRKYFLCTQAMAGTMGQIELDTPKSWTWVGTLSEGPIWENAGQTQTFYLTPDIIKTYTVLNTTQTLAYADIFVGIQKDLPRALQGQLGIAAAVTSNAKFSGNIWDDLDFGYRNIVDPEQNFNLKSIWIASLRSQRRHFSCHF